MFTCGIVRYWFRHPTQLEVVTEQKCTVEPTLDSPCYILEVLYWYYS